MGVEELSRALREDVGYVMRRRAEEGYGLNNVRHSPGSTTAVLTGMKLLLNAALATQYHGRDRLAGVWEFVDRML